MKLRGYTYGAMLLAGSLFTSTSWAKGEAHLLFHMGLGANGKFFVGGTLQNKGDAPVAGGYLAILSLSAKCQPGKLSVHSFEPLAPGEKKEFRVPMESPLSGYRLMGFGAYDDMGFPLPAIDETAEIIKKRRAEERKACLSARSPASENKSEKPKS
ncbi:hypothetical protein [Xenorhabdus szentirmaii]|uniref:Membrane-associated Zn-dependent protease 1 n=2 Tax=Xenorhabdus szentirmaii TaxID=290112 RepID=W1J697_9GAMM|nr:MULTISPECIES: hypothetical protein [Xenorhabdus]MBD2782182.1 membrane-associated Zn-dependent protease 1 [Xenorhabdus sp. 38]MBD2793818.1 membrane-associated Zn-dependent protease 1 [Xenorhabdus sp. CUL]MBD2801109.1 membrane-associated Zn-dependent protease 1 [Xenorhabdus sp. M]MBD2805533.1 membrane-associated Zn-dependent protease 1 [Xenorhabdus sp. ZM]MBD2821677.1 membrane-associated Zn-dependent protease 1 [Xenorhabdus sp. 42]